jgi:hypothetical protein
MAAERARAHRRSRPAGLFRGRKGEGIGLTVKCRGQFTFCRSRRPVTGAASVRQK